MASPPYVAVIVTEFCETVDVVYDTMHVPDDRLQKAELNVPPPFPSFQDIEPIGVVGELELSVTVAMSVT